jgi:hypothetical protein
MAARSHISIAFSLVRFDNRASRVDAFGPPFSRTATQGINCATEVFNEMVS